MLLVIPSLEIRGEQCVETITALKAGYLDPAGRARLLRKENAKALHLVVDDEDAWCDHALGLVKKIREAVDIPTEVSLTTMPADSSDIAKLISYGVYRIVLPASANDEIIGELVSKFSAQRIVPALELSEVSVSRLASLKALGVQRIALQSADTDTISINWEKLEEAVNTSRELKLRLTCLFGVTGYQDLHRLDGYSPVVDSVVLGVSLLHNAFPCQGLWREAEQRSIEQYGEDSNLWRNPLEGIAHI